MENTGMKDWTVHLTSAIVGLLDERVVAGDVDCGHVIDTPRRVLKAWAELLSGYNVCPEDFLEKTFHDIIGYDEMVHVEDIPIHSICQHHLLPFIGYAHFAYVPKNKFVGLSKIPRFIDAFARRLQVQEALSQQIVTTFQNVVEPVGCAVYIRCFHCCMSLRGVKCATAITSTTAFRGGFKTGSAKTEFLGSINRNRSVL